MCTRLDTCLDENHLPLERAVLVAWIMVRYPISVGALLSANKSLVAQQENTSYPYPSTITEYLVDAKVKERPYNIKIKRIGPFDLYSLKDPKNPKNKKSSKLPAITGQSEEHVVAAIGTSDIPFSSVYPSPCAIIVSTKDSTPPPAPGVRPVPMPASQCALQVTRTLVSLNNWM